MTDLIANGIKLLLMIFGIYLDMKKQKQDSNEKYIIDQREFENLVTQALGKMRSDAATESQQAGKIEDRMDGDQK